MRVEKNTFLVIENDGVSNFKKLFLLNEFMN